MSLALMKFGSYTFSHNPKTLVVDKSSRVTNVTLADGSPLFTNVSDGIRRVSAIAELFGKDCFEQYNSLDRMCRTGKWEVLSVPEVGSFKAVLSDIKLSAEPKADVITVSLEFTVFDDRKYASEISPRTKHTVKKGENLWDISFQYGVSLERLVELNPSLRSALEIEVGKEVRLD